MNSEKNTHGYETMKNNSKLFHYVFVWFLPFLIFLFLEGLFFFYQLSPNYLYWAGILSILFILWGTKQIIGKINFQEYLLIVLVPFFLVLGQFLFIVFLNTSAYTKHIAIAISQVFLWIFLENIYLKFHHKEKYHEYDMGNIMSFLHIFVIYLMSSSLFGFIIFLGIPVWLGSFLMMIIGFFLTLQVIIIQGIPLEKAWIFIIMITFLLFEIFWVINFLPSSYYVNAFIFTVMYYIMTGISRNYLLGILQKGVAARYLGIGIVSLFIILLTAKWG